MERLTGIDAGFLYMETPTAPTHTLKVLVFDPAPGEACSFEGARARLAARLHRLPGFRRRVVPVPLGLHHPVWIEDPDFDLDRHLRRGRVAPPGGRRELDAAVSDIAGRPLERDRPLWELWLLEGLEGGRLAAVAKIHHAMADGTAAARLLAHVTDGGPDDAPPPADPRAPEPLPSSGRLVRDAVADRLRQLATLPALLLRTARSLRSVLGRRLRSGGVRAPLPLLDTPRTPFNTSLTPRRRFAGAELSLADVRRAKDAAGVTVNDVLLALVAGSLRRYLADRGALPDRPLVVEVPVSTDAPGSTRLGGNRVSNLFAFLRTDLADPRERLRATGEAMGAAKEAHALLGSDLYGAWSELAAGGPYARFMRRYSRRRLADRRPPAVNAIVSSVRGPPEARTWAGAPLRAVHSVGPLLEGIGLNVTLWSYRDRVYVGALACPDRVAGLDRIAGGLEEELRALLGALDPAGHPPSASLEAVS